MLIQKCQHSLYMNFDRKINNKIFLNFIINFNFYYNNNKILIHTIKLEKENYLKNKILQHLGLSDEDNNISYFNLSHYLSDNKNKISNIERNEKNKIIYFNNIEEKLDKNILINWDKINPCQLELNMKTHVNV